MAVDREKMRSVVETYLEGLRTGDVDALVGVFAEDAVLEDPFGTPPSQGSVAIREFYSILKRSTAEVALNVYRAAGDSAAFSFTIDKRLGDKTMHLTVVEVMDFAEDGTVAHMRAYWSQDDMAFD